MLEYPLFFWISSDGRTIVNGLDGSFSHTSISQPKRLQDNVSGTQESLIFASASRRPQYRESFHWRPESFSL